MESAKKTCFVISPIGEPDTDVRKRSDQILGHVIRPAVETYGYVPVRADQMPEPGIITSQVIQHIVNDPLVVADLTGRNANVFYELAVRHVIRKPFIQLISKGEKMPFDVAGTRTISIDRHDLDSVANGITELKAQVESLEKDGSNIESPISISLDLQLLSKSDKPEQRTLSEIIAMLTELRTSTESLEKIFKTPEVLIPQSYIREMVSTVLNTSKSEVRIPSQITLLARELSRELSDRLEHADLGEPVDTHQIRLRMDRLRQLLDNLINEANR